MKRFDYDNQGVLANADIPGVSRTAYGHDWAGNLASPTAVYNDADQLTSYGGNTYNYNTYGDMTSGAGRSYSIDGLGRVYRITLNGETYNYGYNAHGLRISYDDTYDWTVYTYDVTASVPAVISEMHIWDDIYNYYVREPNGALVMRLNGTDKKYYHFDELGSTLFLMDANGIQTDKYVYNAWGKVVSSSGTTVNPFKYVGQLGYYQDAGTGLYWVGTRFYDPDAGVFTQRDMAKGGLSYYAYTSGQSMVAVDPWGEISYTDYFVLRYFAKAGGGVDLADVGGLLQEYRRQSKAGGWGNFQSYNVREFVKYAKTACKDPSNKNNTKLVSYPHPREILEVTVGAEVNASGRPDLSNPLHCLGGGLLNAFGQCTVTVNCRTRKLKYSCNYGYFLKDLFANPRSFKGHDGKELRYAWPDYHLGEPYWIYAHWDETDNSPKGGVDF